MTEHGEAVTKQEKEPVESFRESLAGTVWGTLDRSCVSLATRLSWNASTNSKHSFWRGTPHLRLVTDDDAA
jgi:hypothetical protein